MHNRDWFFTLVSIVFGFMFVAMVFGAAYNVQLKLDCVNSGDMKSPACFKYVVMNDNFRNNNVNLNLNAGE